MSVELWQTDSAADAWAGVIRPWLERVARASFSRTRPSVLVCPSRAHRNEILGRMHEAAIRSVAVHFLTPVELRPFLARRLGVSQPVALREHLRLLLAAAAERTARDAADGPTVRQTAESVAREPNRHSGHLRVTIRVRAKYLQHRAARDDQAEATHASTHPCANARQPTSTRPPFAHAIAGLLTPFPSSFRDSSHGRLPPYSILNGLAIAPAGSDGDL
jgi:hypothetical protein